MDFGNANLDYAVSEYRAPDFSVATNGSVPVVHRSSVMSEPKPLLLTEEPKQCRKPPLRGLPHSPNLRRVQPYALF